MCVILTAESKRPTSRALEAAAKANPDGAGLAWLDRGRVHYLKTLDPEVIIAKAVTVPLPFVVHFRITTIGETIAELCHPFPFGAEKAHVLSGATKEGVLFHNGTWRDWATTLIDASSELQEVLPEGPWNDSRAIAFLARYYSTSIFGPCVPDSQRVAILTPQGIERFGFGWEEVATGVHASNLRWTELLKRPTASASSPQLALPNFARQIQRIQSLR